MELARCRKTGRKERDGEEREREKKENERESANKERESGRNKMRDTRRYNGKERQGERKREIDN